jgi:acyl-CoA synthetase (NDP forming)
LRLTDCIDFLVEDAATSVIAVYLEGLRDAAKFRTAVRRAVAAQKPVVAFKVGRSEAGARSAMSHTGALAGADRMYEALFRQLGVIRAGTFADLLALQPGGIAVVSQSGGIMGSLLSRAADRGIGLSKLIATGNKADIDVAGCPAPAPSAQRRARPRSAPVRRKAAPREIPRAAYAP